MFLKDFFFHLACWVIGLSIWGDMYFLHELGDVFFEKVFLSMLMILFYSMRDTMQTSELFFKQRKHLMQNKIIKKTIKRIYSENNKGKNLSSDEIFQELIIDRDINSVSFNTIYDQNLLKIRFLREDPAFQEKMEKEVKFGSKSLLVN